MKDYSTIAQELKQILGGDISVDESALEKYSTDASIFKVRPQLIVYPKDSGDVKKVVDYVNQNKKEIPDLSITGRSAGTDMTGGPLNTSIILDFTKYINHIRSVKSFEAVAEPGVFYRDFEKETLKQGLLMPSYPASKSIAAIGGMVSNNAGGELSLRYGKTQNFVKKLKMIWADGNEYEISPLNKSELDEKLKKKDFEGNIYNQLYSLLTTNYQLIQKARPHVSKNSAGYNLWDVWNPETQIFDLTKLFVGSQGTLGMVTEVTFKLVEAPQHEKLLIVFLNNLDLLPQLINDILPFNPDSFESYDDHTFKLALRFLPSILKKMNGNLFMLALQFIPEFFMLITRGLPKLILLVEFSGKSDEEVDKKLQELKKEIEELHLPVKITKSAEEAEKYWLMRRESFNILRQHVKNKHTAPFIDDFIIAPEKIPEFLPKLNAILSKYPELIYTIAGHVGNGNFHIIPLMDLADAHERGIIPKLSDEVYNLVLAYGGSITAEHNDGLIRTPYLEKMFGAQVIDLFQQVKKIFDPDNIFNPNKKVGGSIEYSMKHVKSE